MTPKLRGRRRPVAPAGRSWDLTVTVTDFGPWRPSVPADAGALIAVVNAHRSSVDPKPRVEWWAGQHTLVAVIGGSSIDLSPGEHLVRTVTSSAYTEWGGATPEFLKRLELAPEAAVLR